MPSTWQKIQLITNTIKREQVKFLKHISSFYFRVLMLCPTALIVWSAPVQSQPTISVEEVLAKTDLYISDKWVKEGIRFLDEDPQDLPYLEKLE